MTNTTLTIALNGDVSLDAFAAGVRAFHELIEALSAEIGRDAAIDWTVVGLEAGSAIATIRGESEQDEVVERVVRAYDAVGRALQGDEPIPYSDKVVASARALTKILNGRVTSIRFETADDDVTIAKPLGEQPPPLLGAYGAIEGRVLTLTSRNEPRFTLYDALNDRAVSCYLQEGQEELMRGVWGHRAIVKGWVSRDPKTGRPVTIRRITDVILLEDTPPGTYRRARGIAPIGPGDLRAEEAIRRVRDA